MKSLLNIRRFALYAWMGLGFTALGVLSNLVQYHDEAARRIIDDCWRIGFVTILNYAFFEHTLPILRWKKFIRYIVAYIFLYSVGLYCWRQLGVAAGIYTPFPLGGPDSHPIAAQFEYSFSSFVFFAIIRHFYNHIKLQRTTRQLRIEKQEAELNFLKSQTNPHFLFNTLNNIYSLARDKSDLAPEMILRLSKILRYMLYEAGGPYIAIEQELKIISDYISLEQLRYDESLRINFNYDVEDMRQAIPPLLMIPLVENAFKHGAAETRHQPFVDIHLSIKKRQLSFVVRNSTGESAADESTTSDSGAKDPAASGKVKENIGLSNLRRQLELLYTDYTISLQQSALEFSATLQINLASHV